MKLRAFPLILTLALGLLAVPLPPEAQQAGKVYQIGILSTNPLGPANLHIYEAFWQGLRELGYVEGQNITFEYRFAKRRQERFPELAAELVRLQVDIIVASAPAATYAAKEATRTIPIVSLAVVDPVRLGFVQSLARPGGNITGLTLTAGQEIAGKWLELLKVAVPKVSRVAVLWNPASPTHPPLLRETEVAARALRVQLQPLGARGPDELDSAFSAIIRERAGALLVFPNPVFLTHRTRLADFAAKNHLPAMYGLTPHVVAGGLMAYAASLPDLFRRAAGYIDKILKGAKPADLPVEQPTKFDLVINLKTAKALGLTIPDSLLFRADRVIK